MRLSNEAHAPSRVASLAPRLLCWPPRPQDRRHRLSPLRPLQQGRRCVWPRRRRHRSRRLLCPAQPLHLLCRRPYRPRMGPACCQGCMLSSFLHLYHFLSRLVTGGPETDSVLCPPLLCRPRRLDRMDCLFRTGLVDLDSPRRQPPGQLSRTTSHDRRRQHYPASH